MRRATARIWYMRFTSGRAFRIPMRVLTTCTTAWKDFSESAQPQTGDLVVWRGHAGIVIRPSRHVFFSFLHAGPGTDDYRSRYWSGRGDPRFYRYVKNDALARRRAVRASVGGWGRSAGIQSFLQLNVRVRHLARDNHARAGPNVLSKNLAVDASAYRSGQDARRFPRHSALRSCPYNSNSGLL